MKDLIIVGAGGFGRELLQWCKEINAVEPRWNIKGFIDDNRAALDGYECDFGVIGAISDWVPDENEEFVVALGFPAVKRRVIESLVFAVINYLINAFPNRKLLNYSYGQQIMDAAPPMLLSAFMFGIVYCVRFLVLSNWLTLIVQIPLGVLIYVGGTKLFKLDSFDYILGTVKGLICK